VLQQLRSALAIISEHEPARITTVGGECSVSMAPFSYLINKHGDDLAILWIDSHPDMGTGETAFARARWRVPPHAGPNFGSDSPTACDPIRGRTAARHSVVVRKLTGAGHWRGPRPGNATCCPS
jgi:Arginase family